MEAEVRRRWWHVLDRLRRRSPSTERVLRMAVLEEVTETDIVVSWPFRFHHDVMAAPERRALVELLIAEVMERPYHLRCRRCHW